MKGNEEKQLDQVASKTIQKVAVKSPSADFTQLLMDKIQASQAPQTTIAYQPLISKRMWILLTAIGAALISIAMVQNIELISVTNLVDNISNTVPSYDIPSWELPTANFKIEATNPFVYGTLILASFLLLEIVILKRKYKW